jgi:acyl carrier protein
MCELLAEAALQSIPIGHPITNVEAYVLNQHLQPVSIGAPGELHLGGSGLARGYLNNPDLTAEKFIPHPFTNIPGARLYRTGDLASYRSDGSIEFLGRKDHQVKLRGFRIELGEIENALAEHLLVKNAVVLHRDDGPAGPYLVAYLLTSRDTAVSPDALRNFLRERLPEYMVPSAFVFLDALPRTPNGKVDYRSLPIPDFESDRLETEFVAPRTPTEEQLANIWQEVLGLERVGIHDNFFELGGHSLLATQVISRARDNFGVALPLLRLFEIPTIAGLTELIETIRLAERGAQSQPSATTSEREAGEL